MKYFLLTTVSLLFRILSLNAQNTMKIHMIDGSVIFYNINEVDSISWNDNDDNSDSSTEEVYEFVDLGLSVNWATCNIGASTPENYGQYFSWGETKAKNRYDKDNYLHYNPGYTVIDKDGFEVYYPERWSNLGNEIHASSYDAAYVKWGEEWRMPTHEEFQELIEYCTWEWKQKFGVDGYKITGTNGNWIFLPAAGCITSSNIVNQHSESLHYWTSTSERNNEHCSYQFYGSSNNNLNVVSTKCHYGLTIRPVQNTQPFVIQKVPYKSPSFNDFNIYNLKELGTAWTKYSGYCQATGYQEWNGGSRSKREVESCLISPQINTNCITGKLRISFDQTILYTYSVKNWQKNLKVLISKDYDGNPEHFTKALWEELGYNPKTSSYNDWTMYSSGNIKIPEEFLNCKNIHIALYFYCPNDAYTLWNIKNLIIEEGEAEDFDNSLFETEPLDGTKDSPFTVKAAKNYNGSNGYVNGYIVGYVNGPELLGGAKFEAADITKAELLLADSPTCKDVNLTIPVYLPTGEIRQILNPSIKSNIGKKVTIYGAIGTFLGTTGVKNCSWAMIDDKYYGAEPPMGNGTENDPYNVQGIVQYTMKALPGNTISDPLYIRGIVCDNPNINTSSFGNASLYISDYGNNNDEKFYCSRLFDFNNSKFTEANKICKGDTILIYGQVSHPLGYPETAGNDCYLISINGKNADHYPNRDNLDNEDADPNEEVIIKGTHVTLINKNARIGNNYISVDLSTLGYENTQEADNIFLSDGTIISFGSGTSTYVPRYYTATNGIRVYANNTITFKGKSKIAKILIECDSFNGTDYVGNTTATLSCEGNIMIYKNTTESSGTQMRVQKITIYYAD